MTSKTGLIFFPAFDWAISPTHPEREERLLYTKDQLFEEGLMDLPEIEEFAPRLASHKDIARTHFCVPKVSDQVLEAHLIASGAGILLAEKVWQKELKNAFALVRPPGHHSMRVVHGNRGFCNINNEAIVVDYLRHHHGLKKIAIVDTDVHHGDGTQEIFYHDPDVLCISFHQDGRTIYPGTGFINELGGPTAFARTLNVPLPVGTTDEELHYVLDEFILPVLRDFQPEFIINSAGQDNHYTDPLGSICMTAQGYALLNEKLKPDLAVLEGGYAIETALPYVNLAIILAMAGQDYSYVREPHALNIEHSKQRTTEIKATVAKLQEIWRNRDQIDLDKIFGKKQYWQRKKSVYYDTDGFSENQTEVIKRCGYCSGYLTVESTAARGSRKNSKVFCISIPITACRSCQEEAYKSYSEAQGNSYYDYVYMQDKVRDVFLIYNKQSRQESSL
ncbi:Histone deacetylase [Desulfofarcimen acetoxidans DSM 771]|uniref:Histone deacetylase n=1 Tax=Desulfofarcimen acetoxidans (strain ATCC 49208 / DSM 771 / KCTC 5769 / VKM B-1644 / 5575) TaxID=485916 RepID=C8VZ45_DESAS|nr:histone deacetylase [Desulfofarcimen acetoxidans]ACV62955.1 Histone deacetylase [Desulfofarcimen acetoxidans DSM 771]